MTSNLAPRHNVLVRRGAQQSTRQYKKAPQKGAFFLFQERFTLVNVYDKIYFPINQGFLLVDEVRAQLQIQLRSLAKEQGVSGVLHLFHGVKDELRMLVLIEASKIFHERGTIVPGFKDYIEAEIKSVEQLVDVYTLSIGVFEDMRQVPRSIRRGIAQAFNKFSAEEFAAYNEGAVQLSFLLRFVHPEPRDAAMSLIFKKILNGTIKEWKT